MVPWIERERLPKLKSADFAGTCRSVPRGHHEASESPITMTFPCRCYWTLRERQRKDPVVYPIDYLVLKVQFLPVYGKNALSFDLASETLDVSQKDHFQFIFNGIRAFCSILHNF